MVIHRILKKYLTITNDLMEIQENYRARQLQIYIDTMEGVIALRGMSKERMLEKDLIETNDRLLNVLLHLLAYCER